MEELRLRGAKGNEGARTKRQFVLERTPSHMVTIMPVTDIRFEMRRSIDEMFEWRIMIGA